MSVIERTREIGVLCCIGGRAGDIRRIFMTEGVVLVALGWLTGMPLGFAIDRFLVWLVRDSINAEVTFTFPLGHVPLTLAGTVALALAVILLPLRRAVRLQPGEPSATPEPAPWPRAAAVVLPARHDPLGRDDARALRRVEDRLVALVPAHAVVLMAGAAEDLEDLPPPWRLAG